MFNRVIPPRGLSSGVGKLTRWWLVEEEHPAAIIRPAMTHGDVIISAIASRNLKQAQENAKKYGIPMAYGSYEELLNEPGIDAVYISLPNGLHGSMCGSIIRFFSLFTHHWQSGRRRRWNQESTSSLRSRLLPTPMKHATS